MTTALQTTSFDFYGDELLAIKDNASGEIYTSINTVLRGIGFTATEKIRKIRDKWLNDSVVSKGCQVFTFPSQRGCPKKDTPSNEQKTYCISQRKLPIALAKINITPRMKREHPEIASKLELYQDKCADVLASVFIDHKSSSDIYIQPILESINSLTNTVNESLAAFNERLTKFERLTEENTCSPHVISKRRFSYWASKMMPKYQLLKDHLGVDQKTLYRQLFLEFGNLYPEIELNQLVDDYCYENRLESCFTLDAIEHDKTIRQLFESMVDNLLRRYHMAADDPHIRAKTIFDDFRAV